MVQYYIRFMQPLCVAKELVQRVSNGCIRSIRWHCTIVVGKGEPRIQTGALLAGNHKG